MQSLLLMEEAKDVEAEMMNRLSVASPKSVVEAKVIKNVEEEMMNRSQKMTNPRPLNQPRKVLPQLIKR